MDQETTNYVAVLDFSLYFKIKIYELKKEKEKNDKSRGVFTLYQTFASKT